MIANQIAGALAGGVAASTSSYESIATFTVGSGGSASIDFTSIPSTYKHLQLRMLTNDNYGREVVIQLNSDGGANYTRHRIKDDGTGNPTGYYALSNTRAFVGANSAYASIYAGFVTDILDYANVNKYTTIRSFGGYDRNTTNSIVQIQSSMWANTAAVTSITVKSTGDSDSFASNFIQYSHFALYGIKG